MRAILPLVLSIVFLILALWHFRMALLPSGGAPGGAVPSVGGKPLFVPSAGATVAVGLLLLVCAGLVAATGGLIGISVPPSLLYWLSLALALGLLARAIGEFKYVGFFKRVRGSRFATLDTFVYSPLCLLLALGVALVALGTGV
ncbi:MAG: hypothetical protein JWR21_3927 [Herminiimonas sp.]|nr:hypothetical protein [Herminiimonas sp.]MDB5853111.1 hypothetical protein [Herminiimonas sp.]